MDRKRWTLWLALVSLAFTGPVLWAGDTDADETETPEAEETTKEDLVQRLALLTLDHNVVPARMLNLPWAGKTKTLIDVIEKLEEWSEDNAVSAVMLNIADINLGLADTQELSQAIHRLKAKNKKVFAYVHAFNPNGYLLACTADEICASPAGSVILPGFGFTFPFMKGHYQMLGLEYDVITAGRYKYPGYMNQRQSNQYFQEELNALADSWYADYVNIIAQARNLKTDAVHEIVNRCILDADEALQRGLVDKLAYQEEYERGVMRRERMKKYRDSETDWSEIHSLQDLLSMMNKQWQEEKKRREAVGPKIAILHARGMIIDVNLGPAFSSMFICRDDFIKVIQEIRKNKSIKGVVLRVDSPGGSANASDAIWDELRRLDEKKPLVVSMGGVAGSGGYYIAVPGRKIIAQSTTITGSIGVLGILQNAWSAINRADYNLEFMKRGERALFLSPFRPMSKTDRDFMQDWLNVTYEMFIDRVARGRKMAREQVKELAEGRIYTGRDALAVGLIDEVGGLDEAVKAVRELAEIPESAKIRLVHYPRSSSLGEIVADMGSMSASVPDMNSEAGIAAFMNLMKMANTPAQSLSFDKQVELFSQSVQPLCWLPIPDLTGHWSPMLNRMMDDNGRWSQPSPDRIKAMVLHAISSPWVGSADVARP